jgi:hypothetical protein
MELPPNFKNYLPLIHYYRNTLNIDCLTSTNEKLRLYAGYHLYKTKIPLWVSNDLTYGYKRDWYECRSLRLSYKCQLIQYQKNDLMYNELKEVLPHEIKEYLYDLYPCKPLKLIKRNHYKIITLISSNDEIIRLDNQQFKLYCGLYNTIIKPYKNDFKENKTINIPLQFSKNTAECIEQLINLENNQAYKNAIDLYEYISMYDYLDVSF